MTDKEPFEIRLQESLKLAARKTAEPDEPLLSDLSRVQICLQWGHRLASIGLLALVAGIAAIIVAGLSQTESYGTSVPSGIKSSTYGMLLMAGFVAADCALVAAIFSWWLDKSNVSSLRETWALILFSLVIMILSLALYLMAKSQVLASQVKGLLSLFGIT